MIDARIRTSFGGFALDVSLRAGAGITILFGPSGAGKTLTLDSIAGFAHPDEGRIELDGRIVFDGAAGVDLPPRDRGCGYVFQNYALFPHMTLRENLRFGAARWNRLERHRRVQEALDRFRIAAAADRRPHEASGGEKQRCSIARALIGQPRVLLLDEPGRGLDAVLRAELYETLREVRESFGTPMLLVSHDLDECFALGDQMLVLMNGRVVQSGTPAQVAAGPANLEVARLLGIFNLIPAEVLALDPGANRSRLRVHGQNVEGSYLPGKLLGDRVTLCVRPDELRIRTRNGKLAANELGLAVKQQFPRPGGVRLELEHGLLADVASAPPDDAGPLAVGLPEGALRAL